METPTNPGRFSVRPPVSAVNGPTRPVCGHLSVRCSGSGICLPIAAQAGRRIAANGRGAYVLTMNGLLCGSVITLIAVAGLAGCGGDDPDGPGASSSEPATWVLREHAAVKPS